MTCIHRASDPETCKSCLKTAWQKQPLEPRKVSHRQSDFTWWDLEHKEDSGTH